MAEDLDKGWAWVVLAACFVRSFMVIGINKAFGIFFVEYVNAFDTSSSTVSSIISTQNITFSISSFLILTVGNKFFPIRPIIMFGSTLMAAGYFLNAFAPNVYFLLLSQGVLFGMGQAAASGPSVVLLNTYFEKKRGLANSLSNSGGSLGGLLLPLIIQSLLETYGLFGAQIVVSGMLLNIVVAGALMRTRTDKTTKKMQCMEIEVGNESTIENGNTYNVNNNMNSLSVSSDNITDMHRGEEKEKLVDKASLKVIIPETVYTRPRTFSENLHEHRFTGFPYDKEIPLSADAADESKLAAVSALFGSLADVTSSVQSIFLARKIKSVDEAEDDDDDSKTPERNSCLSRYCLSVINFRILKNHYLKCIYLVGFLAIFGSRLQLAYIPAYAGDHGVSSRNISYLITIVGSCDFIGRFVVSWIADSKRIKRNHIIAVALTIVGVASLFTSFLTDFPLYVAYCVLYGLFGGLYNSMLSLLLVDAVGVKHLSTALAFAIQVHGVSISAFAPILGLIRDKTGSYVISFYIMGVGMLLSAALMLFVLPFVKKIELKRQQHLISADD